MLEIEPEIVAMRAAGKTRREIAEYFGLEVRQIVWWVSRYNRKQAKLAAGIAPRPKGRPRKDGAPRNIEAEQAYEINRSFRALDAYPDEQCSGAAQS